MNTAFKMHLKRNSMEQRPSWEADSHSTSQEFPRFLRNPKVHYRLHNSSPLVPILNQMQPVHIFPPYFPKIHSNIILPSMTRSSEWPLHFRFADQNFVRTSRLSHACYIQFMNNFRHENVMILLTKASSAFLTVTIPVSWQTGLETVLKLTWVITWFVLAGRFVKVWSGFKCLRTGSNGGGLLSTR